MRRLEWNGDLRPAAIALLAVVIGYDCARMAGRDQVVIEANLRIEEHLERTRAEALRRSAEKLKAETEAAETARRNARAQVLRLALSAVEGGAERLVPFMQARPTLALSSPAIAPTPASLAPRPHPPAIDRLLPGSGQSARDTLADGTPCPYCPDMIVAPAGTFMMGAPANEPRQSHYDGREEPQHPVTFAHPLAIARHPVTRAEFAAFVQDTGVAIGANCQVWDGTRWLPLGNCPGVSGGFEQVRTMAVYNDRLYVGGSFSQGTTVYVARDRCACHAARSPAGASESEAVTAASAARRMPRRPSRLTCERRGRMPGTHPR